MAASKPTSSLSRHDHILRYTQRPLRGLSCGSGFFPSRRWTLSLNDCLPRSIRQVFGVWLGLVGRSGPRAHPVALPPADNRLTPFSRLYLNRFRGEPAISRLDWPFTPTHKSSERFSTHTGSGLHCGVTPASPCSWVDRPGFGSTPWNFSRPRYRTRFRYGSAGNRLSLAPE